MLRGTRVAKAYIDAVVNGEGINEDLVDAVASAGPGVEKAGDEHGKAYGEHFGDSLNVQFSHAASSAGDELNRRLSDAGEDGGKDYGDNFEKSLKRMSKRIGERVGDRVGAAMAERLEESFAGLIDVFEERLAKMQVSGNRGASGRDNDVLGDKIGVLLGAGSRNNFLNLFGKSMGNIVNLTTRAATAAKTLFTTFSKGFTQAAEGASFFQKSLSGFSAVGAGAGGGISKMLSSLVASGPAAAAAIGAIVVAMSALVSVVSALLALLTALISTIVSGLVGAFTVLGGAMGAVIAAAGLLTVAFTSMTDAQQKALGNAFRPLKAELTGIGQIMIKEMVPAFAVWSRNLQEALLLAAPVAQVMGKAFARAGKIITSAFSGPGFARFAQTLTVFLPSIIRRLSSALGGFLNGMLGLFSAVMPFVRQFAVYLDGVAKAFSRWANSAQGQNAIVDFTKRALTSLRSLWNFVKEFVGFVTDILFSRAAQNAGNTIFDGLTQAFKGFRRSISNGDLEKWFSDAIKFAKSLKEFMKGLGDVIAALYNSGVLEAVGKLINFMGLALQAVATILGPLVDLIGFALPRALDIALGPMTILAKGVIALGDGVKWVLELLGRVPGAMANIPRSEGQSTASLANLLDPGGDLDLISLANAGGVGGPTQAPPADLNLPSLINTGTAALANTGLDLGGSGGAGGGGPKKFHNPLRQWALSLIKEGPTLAAQIKKALTLINKQVAAAIQSVAQGSDAGQVRSALASMIQNISSSAQSTVSAAREALNSAALNLANATSKASMQRALNQVRKSQQDLANALKNQKRIEAVAKLLSKQRDFNESRVQRLLDGLKVQNATLADFALARQRLAVQIEKANQKLQEAIQIRANFRTQVAESIKAFGALTTAQAQTIDGVEQALTHSDITSNLEDRLAKIRAFQANLRILLAQGLSNAAYKQIVDAGVETGSAFATALIEGGTGAVKNVNELVGQINATADALGLETSNRMYSAGVAAAQGLVDGLNSLSAQLNSAATKLGNAIANSIKNALGIKSPSRVLMDMMNDVGDGAVIGLDNQHSKVGQAAVRFSDQIAVSPEVAAWASRQGSSPTVSGNGDQRPIDLTIITPTEDPMAVAQEAINELTGRL